MRNNQFVLIVVGIFLLLTLFAPRAQAADTSDVIAGIIFGGIVGSQIEKNKDRDYMEDVYLEFPYGTIIVDPIHKRYRKGYNCFWEMDIYGYPTSATPVCNSTNSRYSRYSGNKMYVRADIKVRELAPCGGYWGAGCRKLIDKLKTGEIEGVFDFTTR